MRAVPAIVAALMASAITASATSEVSPIDFFLLETGQRVESPKDIRPGGALKASSSFIQGRLKCADNVNAMLRANGYRGTGSSMARSFLEYGIPVSGPRPGAIQVERRGWNPRAGHVQIVSHQKNGVWMCKNPSSRVGDWVERPCANPRVIAYRMPTAKDVASTLFASAQRRPVSPQRTRNASAPPVGEFGNAIVPSSTFVRGSFQVASR